MMKKLNDFIKKYQLPVIIALLVCATGIICALIFAPKNKIKMVKEDNKLITFQYDSTWKITEKKDDKISLKHKSDSTVDIQLTELDNNYKYSSITELIDELLYTMGNQNSNYKLISKKEETVTKSNYDGYKFLYENGDKQALVTAYKVGDLFISIVYEASNDYFDILLDSVHNIIYNIEIKGEEIVLKDSVQMNLSNASYAKDDEFDKLITGTKSYKIAYKHYLVEYELPNIFKQYLSISSSNGNYEYEKDFLKKIEISTRILNTHIYEKFDMERSNIFSSNSIYHDDKHPEYTDFKESVSKLDSEYEAYIYKCSYTYKTTRYDDNFNSYDYYEKDEKAVIIYALSNNYVFELEIRASDIPITQKLIDNIIIKNITNYAEYVTIEKDGDNIIGRLMQYVNYDYKKIREVTLKIPNNYIEKDEDVLGNIYESRHYKLNYDENYDLYDYEVIYTLSKSYTGISKETYNKSVDSINNIYVKDTYGKASKLSYKKTINLNGKEFYMYSGGYTDRSGVLFQQTRKTFYVNKVMLFCKISDDSYLEININGNGKEINNEILTQLTNFVVSEKEV